MDALFLKPLGKGLGQSRIRHSACRKSFNLLLHCKSCKSSGIQKVYLGFPWFTVTWWGACSGGWAWTPPEAGQCLSTQPASLKSEKGLAISKLGCSSKVFLWRARETSQGYKPSWWILNLSCVGNLWLISDLFLDTWALIAGSQKNCAFWGTPYHPCLLRLICRAWLGGVICTQDHPLCLTLFGCTVIADGALIFANEYVLCNTHYQ